jgi:hypothetical protein
MAGCRPAQPSTSMAANAAPARGLENWFDGAALAA